MTSIPRLLRPLLLSLALVLAAAVAADAAEPSPALPSPDAKPPQAAPSAAKDGAMVSVPAGPFLAGCNAAVDTECMPDEPAAAQLEVAAFQIDQNEVTVAQYARCAGAKACSTDGLMMPFYGGKEQPEYAEFCNWKKKGRLIHPINCVSWSQAEAFCKWAGKRLPTEAEWEKAARGGDGRKYPWGNAAYAGSADKVANIADDAAKKRFTDWSAAGYDDGHVGTAVVGSFPAGAAPSGANDMVGNVWEWLADARDGGRAIRGGSWTFDPRIARVSLRGWSDPAVRAADGGFRCAK